MEVEIMAASEGVRSAVWLEKLTRDLGERDDDNPFIPTLYCDNKGTVDLLYETTWFSEVDLKCYRLTNLRSTV